MTPEGDRMCCWEQRGGGDGEYREEAPNCLELLIRRVATWEPGTSSFLSPS